MAHTRNALTKLKGASINYHFTRKCNFRCAFCFHTSKTSHVLSLQDQLRLISLLSEAGVRKINFAGGEPFLPSYHKALGEMVMHSKSLGLYTSIISNGRHATSQWFDRYGKSLDMFGMSLESLDNVVNYKQGRWVAGAAAPSSGDESRSRADALRVASLCAKSGVLTKINTVVTKYNVHEDLSALINELKPSRWKCFQVLPLEGENCGDGAKRDVTPYLITKDEFLAYIARNTAGLDEDHRHIMKAEPNDVMQSSYILLDEYGRFLDSSTGAKVPTASVLKVGVEEAFMELMRSRGGGFDRDGYIKRDGDFFLPKMTSG